MAKVLFAPGIEIVSGAVTKINLHGSHLYDQNMLLFTHRNAATVSNSCQRGYYRKANSLPWQQGALPSQEVLDLRSTFATASRQVSTRRQNLGTIAADQAQFAAIKDEVRASGYRISFNSFLWAAKKLMGDTFPSGAITMTATQYKENCGSACHSKGL